MKTKMLLFVVSFFGLFAVCHAQQVTLDSNFNGTGILKAFGDQIDFRYDYVTAVAVQQNKVLVGVTGYDGEGYTAIATLHRYLPNGDTDKTFGDNGILHTGRGRNVTYLNSIDFQPDGKLLTLTLESLHSEDLPIDTLWLQRFLPNGTPDSSFGVNGSVFFQQIFENSNGLQVLAKPGGKMVVRFTSNNVPYVVQISGSGGTDHGFGTHGTIVSQSVYDRTMKDMIVLPDNRLVASFIYTKSDATFGSCLVRYTAEGKIDSSFGVNGVLINNNTIADPSRSVDVQLQDGNKILVYTEDAGKNIVLRYRINGAPDANFGINGKAVAGAAASGEIHLLADDKSIVSFTPTRTLERLLPNGIIDSSFGVNGILDVSSIIPEGLTFTTSATRLVISGDTVLGRLEESNFIVGVYKPCTTCRIVSKAGALYSEKIVSSLPQSISIRLYPNPVSSRFTIAGLGNKESTVIITNSAGKTVKESITANANYLCSLQGFAAGLYSVVVWQDGQLIFSSRFVKE